MKKLNKFLAVLMILVLSFTSLFGCGMEGLLSEDTDGSSDDKGIIDTLIEAVTGDSTSSTNTDSNSTDSISSMFSALMGSDWFAWDDSSDNQGWGLSGSGSATGTVAFSNPDSVASGTGTATVLIYLLGSDLESDGGCATADILEMVEANVGSNVNVIIEAGGSKEWQNSVVNPNELNIYKVEGESLLTVKNQKKASMVEPSTVTDFIKWGVENYPADSYSLIFWDHGGGTIAGFGSDELFSGDLTVAEISSAIKDSGVHFKFIGFDACLMGTLEMAYALVPYADYYIASEEVEPGSGWYYTNWLKALEKNPSLDMETLGKMIVDDFLAANNKLGDDVTLSLINLSKVNDVYTALVQYLSQCDYQLRNVDSKKVTSARSKAKAFGESSFDQIDIIDFCKRCDVDGSNELVNAVNNAVVYHRTNMSNTNGLAMYFPYKLTSYYKQISKVLKQFGMNADEYNGFFNDFLSVMAGKKVSKRTVSPMEIKTGYQEGTTQDYSSEEWYNNELASEATTNASNIQTNDDGLIPVTLIDDTYYGFHLSAEMAELIVKVATVAYYDDGEGYIDLGKDDVFQTINYDDGSVDVLVTFSNNWVALNGQVVPYYLSETGTLANGQKYSEGYVIAKLTDGISGEEKNIAVDIVWNIETSETTVIGYKYLVEEGSQAARKTYKFKNGDKIQALCDYYKYDGTYENAYTFGEPIVVDGDITVSYASLGSGDVLVSLYIEDIYNQEYWTESVSFSENNNK